MKYMVTIQHPSQVHFFRHAIQQLREHDHDVRVYVRQKDVVTDLLAAYDIPHRLLAQTPDSVLGLAPMQVKYEYRLLREARRFRPDVLTSTGGVEISHVAPFVGARTVAFNDSEGTPSHRIMSPFLDVVCTPRRFGGEFDVHHQRYDGYHELAYLHPNRFQPDGERLRPFGVDPDERFFVLRFVAWNAHHDVGQRGLSLDAKRTLVSFLSELGSVYITSEDDLPAAFEEYRTPVPPHLVHDLLYYADLYVGDSQTMATESAILGTPAVRSNSFAGDGDMSNFVELEEEYGLLYSTPDEDDALERARTLAADPTTKEEWRRRRDRLLADKIDVTDYVIDVLLEEGRKARDRRSEEGRKARDRRSEERRTVRGRIRGLLTGGGPE